MAKAKNHPNTPFTNPDRRPPVSVSELHRLAAWQPEGSISDLCVIYDALCAAAAGFLTVYNQPRAEGLGILEEWQDGLLILSDKVLDAIRDAEPADQSEMWKKLEYVLSHEIKYGATRVQRIALLLSELCYGRG